MHPRCDTRTPTAAGSLSLDFGSPAQPGKLYLHSDSAYVIQDERDELSTQPTILLDAHVHLQRCFQPAGFLDSARANFREAARLIGRSEIIGCLWLTDPEEE